MGAPRPSEARRGRGHHSGGGTTQKAIALPTHGLEILGGMRRIAQRPANLPDTHPQHSAADSGPGPHVLEQFLRRHDPARPRRQVG
jgi:hypothetical protein